MLSVIMEHPLKNMHMNGLVANKYKVSTRDICSLLIIGNAVLEINFALNDIKRIEYSMWHFSFLLLVMLSDRTHQSSQIVQTKACKSAAIQR
jgi:hypothetical protein